MKSFIILSLSLLLSVATWAAPPTMPSGIEPPTQGRVTVYPNPATHYFMLKDAESVHAVTVYNIMGRPVKVFKESTEHTRFDIQDLPKGMYILRLTDVDNEVLQTLRLNKQS